MAETCAARVIGYGDADRTTLVVSWPETRCLRTSSRARCSTVQPAASGTKDTVDAWVQTKKGLKKKAVGAPSQGRG